MPCADLKDGWIRIPFVIATVDGYEVHRLIFKIGARHPHLGEFNSYLRLLSNENERLEKRNLMVELIKERLS